MKQAGSSNMHSQVACMPSTAASKKRRLIVRIVTHKNTASTKRPTPARCLGWGSCSPFLSSAGRRYTAPAAAPQTSAYWTKITMILANRRNACRYRYPATPATRISAGTITPTACGTFNMSTCSTAQNAFSKSSSSSMVIRRRKLKSTVQPIFSVTARLVMHIGDEVRGQIFLAIDLSEHLWAQISMRVMFGRPWMVLVWGMLSWS
mmetsp:Transcript_10229/g.30361  ORF Transcript_10229/g.30361 Transcript_10229/m.30361 type:complete len:206 (+) Transcript_10229:1108-1725(+)